MSGPDSAEPEWLAKVRVDVAEYRAGWGDAQNLLDEVDELRAKLAEAEMREKLHHGADLTRALQRAEAAEARVRMLTDALFAATGGHVDLGKL